MEFGALAISQLIIGTSTISFLANHSVIAELFCGNGFQFSHAYTYERTYIEHQIPKDVDECLIRIKDKIGNTFTKLIKIQ